MVVNSAILAPAGPSLPSGTVLYIDAEGADGSTTILDLSPIGRTLTANGVCALETTGALKGTSSLAINPANETTGFLACGASSDWNFGTGDFSIEGWAKSNFSSSPGTYVRFLIGNLTYNPDNGWGLGILPNGGNLEFSWNTGSSLAGSGGAVGTTTFHFAVSRNGSNLRMFKDGVMVGKNSSFGSVVVGNNTVDVNIGQPGYSFSDERWRGLIDNLLVVKGTGLRNSDASFTPV
jgi:hypothetical protein